MILPHDLALVRATIFAGFGLAVFLASCGRFGASPPAPATFDAPRDEPGVHNLLRMSDRVYSGSEPHGPEAFETLAGLGVKSVVSVDGAVPDVEAARDRGLRYVHAPIGYDGVPPETCAALAKVLRETEGAVFVHCHHGKHRGPAAAAIAARIDAGLTPEDAVRALGVAGVGSEYPGLWRDAREFDPDSVEGTDPELVEVADPGDMAAAMAEMDRRWGNVLECADAGWKTPPGHADVDPVHEAKLVEESFREMRRRAEAEGSWSAEFLAAMEEAETAASLIGPAVRAGDLNVADRAARGLKATCSRCHAKWRNAARTEPTESRE